MAVQTSTDPSSKPILLFDGVCILCNGFVQFVINRDPDAKISFSALQSDTGQALLKKFGLPMNDFDSFVLVIGDKYYQRSTAGLHVLRLLGGFWSVFFALIIFPAPLRDLVYRVIAKTRYKIFGKLDTCMIPTPDVKRRFLD